MTSSEPFDAGDSIILLTEEGSLYRASKTKGRTWSFEPDIDGKPFTGDVYPAEAVLTVMKMGDGKHFGFRCSIAEGKVLQSSSYSSIQFDNHNFGTWEQWAVSNSSPSGCLFINRAFPDVQLNVNVQKVVAVTPSSLQLLDATNEQKKEMQNLEKRLVTLEEAKANVEMEMQQLSERMAAAKEEARVASEKLQNARTEYEAEFQKDMDVLLAKAVKEKTAAMQKEMDEVVQAREEREAMMKKELEAIFEKREAALRQELATNYTQLAQDQIANAKAQGKAVALKIIEEKEAVLRDEVLANFGKELEAKLVTVREEMAASAKAAMETKIAAVREEEREAAQKVLEEKVAAAKAELEEKVASLKLELEGKKESKSSSHMGLKLSLLKIPKPSTDHSNGVEGPPTPNTLEPSKSLPRGISLKFLTEPESQKGAAAQPSPGRLRKWGSFRF